MTSATAPAAATVAATPGIFSSLMSSAGSLISGVLNNPILGSFGRKIGAAVATALLTKYHADPQSIEAITGGIAALWTVGSSVKAHLPAGSTTVSAVKDAASTAAQAAVNAAIPAILAQVKAAVSSANAPVAAGSAQAA